MKWLVLSCNTGEGHNSAARAIIEAAEKKDITCVLEDPVSFGGTWAKNAVSDAYNKLIQKAPSIFGVVYRAGELFDKTKITSPVYYANSLYAKALQEYLKQEKIDAVICTHLYGMEAMTAIRKKLGDLTPSFGVQTDYTCIPFFAETDMDKYFIPHQDLAPEFEKNGMSGEKLSATGIPVGSAFCEPIGRDNARHLLEIPQTRRVYLVMSGGMGSGDLQSICDEFLKKEIGDFTVYVLAGRNDALHNKLKKRYIDNKQIQIVAFTNKVNLYMEAADVVISKPGGLSSTEALVLGVPLIHLLYIPGCETKNAEFFASRGLSLRADSPADAVRQARDFIDHPEKAERMRRNQRLYSHPDAAKRIVEQVIEHVN